MKTFFLFWVLSWLIQSAPGRLLLAGLALWYLDTRYFGIAAALWAPVVRSRRIAGLEQAVRVNPTDVRSRTELGEVYLQQGQPQRAADHLQEAQRRGEDGPRALYLLGAAWVKLGRHTEGRTQLEAALAKGPDVAFGEPYLYLIEEALATAGAQSPRVDELVSALDRFDSVEVLTRAGRLCAAAGRADLARRLLTEAVQNFEYTPRALRRRQRRWVWLARLGLLRLR